MRRSEDYSETVRRGKKAGGRAVVVHAAQAQAPIAAPMVGFVVTKAVGSAAERNRVKRRLRHLMRERVAGLRPGARIVIRALPEAAQRSSSELAEDLDRALSQVAA